MTRDKFILRVASYLQGLGGWENIGNTPDKVNDLIDQYERTIQLEYCTTSYIETITSVSGQARYDLTTLLPTYEIVSIASVKYNGLGLQNSSSDEYLTQLTENEQTGTPTWWAYNKRSNELILAITPSVSDIDITLEIYAVATDATNLTVSSVWQNYLFWLIVAECVPGGTVLRGYGGATILQKVEASRERALKHGIESKNVNLKADVQRRNSICRIPSK